MLDNVPEGDVKLFVKISHPEYIDTKPWRLEKKKNITI